MKNKQLNKSIRKELNFDLKSYLANNKLLTESIQENKEIDSDLLEIVEEEINSMLDEEYKLKDIKLNYKLFIENKLYTKGLSQIKKLSNENPSINYDIMEILHSGFYSLKDEEYKLKDIINAYNKQLTITVTESIQENKEIDSDLLEIVEEEINSMLDEEYKLKDIKLNYKLFIENKLYSKGLSQIKKLSNENPSLNYDIIEIIHSGFYSLKDEEYKLKDIINAYNKVLTTTVTESSNQTTTNNTPRSKIANSIIKLVSNSYNESDLINLLNSLGPVKPEILKKEAFKLEKLLDILSVNFDSDFPEIQLYYYGFKNYEGTKDIIFKDNKWTTR